MLRRYFFVNRIFGVCLTGCVLITISCVVSCEINAEVFVMMNTYYEGEKFWSQSGIDMGSCAKICMRLTKCESFNFDFTNRDCDINSDLLEDNPHLGKTKKKSIYSRIRLAEASTCTNDHACSSFSKWKRRFAYFLENDETAIKCPNVLIIDAYNNIKQNTTNRNF